MAKETQLIGLATAEQIEQWKKKWGEVTSIEVDGHICYLKPVDRKAMVYALSKMDVSFDTASGSGTKVNMGQIVSKGEVVIQNCWLGGSDEIRNNDQLYIGAAMAAGGMVDFKNAELKNC